MRSAEHENTGGIMGVEEWLMQPLSERNRQPEHKPDPNRGDGYWCAVHGISRCRCELRRWGKYGAAGVLPYHRESQRFLVNERSQAIHHGGTLSTLGGAIDRNEEPLEGALREAEEEMGAEIEGSVLVEHATTVHGVSGTWSYATFVVEVDEMFDTDDSDWESNGHEWLTITELATRKLHAGFKSALPVIVSEMYHGGAFA